VFQTFFFLATAIPEGLEEALGEVLGEALALDEGFGEALGEEDLGEDRTGGFGLSIAYLSLAFLSIAAAYSAVITIFFPSLIM
jgi:hypothetical protein